MVESGLRRPTMESFWAGASGLPQYWLALVASSDTVTVSGLTSLTTAAQPFPVSEGS